MTPYDDWDASSIDETGVLDAVYEILMEFGSEEGVWDEASTTFDLDEYSGMEMRGHADLVKEQWQRECFDLTLYNRDLVYDQNFAAKRVLTIDAAGGPGASFSDPVITEARFTVNEDIRAELKAGAAIILEPGFEAAYGSVVEASIDPLGCSMEVRMASAAPPSTEQPERMRAEKLQRTIPSPHIAPLSKGITVWPNPSAGMSTLRFILPESTNIRWELMSDLGLRVLSSPELLLEAGAHEMTIDGRSLAQGVYVLSVIFNGEAERIRMVFAR